MDAREWATAHGLEFVWEDDWSIGGPDAHRREFDCYEDGGPETCEWVRLIDEENNILASLSCIDDATDEYRREVEHDLMEEAKPERRECGTCGRVWFHSLTPSDRCPWEHEHEEDDRPTVAEEAERLLSYWEMHGNNPETVAKWAVQDMLGILRFIVEERA